MNRFLPFLIHKLLVIMLVIIGSQGISQTISVVSNVSNAACFGSHDGGINLTVSGGVTPYQFAWSNGSSAQNLAGAGAGNYSVTISDSPVIQSFGWSFQPTDGSHVILIPKSGISVDGQPLAAGDYIGAFFLNPVTLSYQCGGYVMITGSEGDFTALTAFAYSDMSSISPGLIYPGFAQGEAITFKVWKNSNHRLVDMVPVFTNQIQGFPEFFNLGTFSTNGISGLSSLTGNSVHTATADFTVGQPVQLGIQLNPGVISCFGGSAQVLVSATGGISPYTGTGSFTVFAGSHSYTVTDSHNCQAQASFSLSQPAVLNAGAQYDPILCHSGQTIVHISATGGSSPYSGTGDFSKPAGSYSFSISDAHSCVSSVNVSISEPAQLLADAVYSPILTPGGSTTVSVSATGGTAPYSGVGNFIRTAGSWSFTVTDVNQCSSVTSVTLEQPTTISLNVKLYLQGLFNTGTGMMNTVMDMVLDEEGNPTGDVEPKYGISTADLVTIELASPDEPYDVVYSQTNVPLGTNGVCSISIPSAYNNYYYLVVKTRNHIETWSAEPIDFTGASASFDFSVAASQAYGDNQKLLSPGHFGFYGGDVDQDGYVMIFDLLNVFNLSNSFAQGFYSADVTGNSYVDIFDLLICFNNSQAFVSTSKPY